jgi:hypothetical protein
VSRDYFGNLPKTALVRSIVHSFIAIVRVHGADKPFDSDKIAGSEE